jgi:hypothetical protein
VLSAVVCYECWECCQPELNVHDDLEWEKYEAFVQEIERHEFDGQIL